MISKKLFIIYYPFWNNLNWILFIIFVIKHFRFSDILWIIKIIDFILNKLFSLELRFFLRWWLDAFFWMFRKNKPVITFFHKVSTFWFFVWFIYLILIIIKLFKLLLEPVQINYLIYCDSLTWIIFKNCRNQFTRSIGNILLKFNFISI